MWRILAPGEDRVSVESFSQPETPLNTPRISLRQVVVFGCIGCGLSLLLLMGFGLVTYGSARAALPMLLGSPLYVEGKTARMGSVPPGGSFTSSYKVTNVSGLPVTIIGARTTCGCAFLESLPLALKPGESADLRFSVTVTKSAPAGKFVQKAELFLDVAGPPTVLTAEADIPPRGDD